VFALLLTVAPGTESPVQVNVVVPVVITTAVQLELSAHMAWQLHRNRDKVIVAVAPVVWKTRKLVTKALPKRRPPAAVEFATLTTGGAMQAAA
jgi:hypothetical protein